MKIKIIGAGSAGNHMAHALSTIKKVKEIYLTDISNKALLRSKSEIYIKRYKKWNKKIKLDLEKKNLKNNNLYDAIVISSPPKFHKINVKNNINKSNIFLIEKPLCAPNSTDINFFKHLIDKYKNKIFMTGYNHRLFPSTVFLKKLLTNERIKYCKVSFKENIGGFLNAHTWMKSINESYLSKTKYGGGALCEHSHALNLLQFMLNDKKIKIINKKYEFNKDKKNLHDKSFSGFLKINSILCEFEQNFETLPVEKKIKVVTEKKILELIYNFKKNNDLILINNFKNIKKRYFLKNRADDFIYEAKYLCKIINNKNSPNILNISNGIVTMETIQKLLTKLI
jgi:predicted dehydrogenase